MRYLRFLSLEESRKSEHDTTRSNKDEFTGKTLCITPILVRNDIITANYILAEQV